MHRHVFRELAHPQKRAIILPCPEDAELNSLTQATKGGKLLTRKEKYESSYFRLLYLRGHFLKNKLAMQTFILIPNNILSQVKFV